MNFMESRGESPIEEDDEEEERSDTNSDDDGTVPQQPSVVVRSFGVLTATDPVDWPSGEQIVQIILQDHHEQEQPTGGDARGSSPAADPETKKHWWQASIRKAMLEKFGYLPRRNGLSNDVGSSSFSSSSWTSTGAQDSIEIESVQQKWKAVIVSFMSDDDGSDESCDFRDFVSSRCSTSNGRFLEWSIMECAPNLQFHLHAHPNIELICCLSGSIHEIRMHGPPITKSFDVEQTTTITAAAEDDTIPETASKSSNNNNAAGDSNNGGKNGNVNVKGPSLTTWRGPWRFGTVHAEEFLVNEVGSIHKSFSGNEGCTLLTLWGGSHANIADPPNSPNIDAAVEVMQGRLLRLQCASPSTTSVGESSSSCCGQWERIWETFLPDSEKSAAQQR
jgi:hypothetical protein